MNENKLEFECCFCGKGIESTKTDPASINMLINIDKDKNKQYSQDFYCHLMCFKERIKPIVSLYLEHLAD